MLYEFSFRKKYINCSKYCAYLTGKHEVVTSGSNILISENYPICLLQISEYFLRTILYQWFCWHELFITAQHPTLQRSLLSVIVVTSVLAWMVEVAMHTITLIHSFGMCRKQRFLAVLRSFIHSPLLCTFSCHISPPTILPSSLTSSCHLFLGLPFNLVVPKFGNSIFFHSLSTPKPT